MDSTHGTFTYVGAGGGSISYANTDDQWQFNVAFNNLVINDVNATQLTDIFARLPGTLGPVNATVTSRL